jgi:DNA-binding response OmpR family regulator
MGDKTGLVDAELLGADATLAKPFTPEQLQKAVAALLAR